MSYTGKRKDEEEQYWRIPPKDAEDGTYIKNIDYGLVKIKVTERGRVSYYCKPEDELITAEDYGFERATALSEGEAVAIKYRLKKEHPNVEIVPYSKR